MDINDWNLLAHWVGIIGIGYLGLKVVAEIFKLIFKAIIYIAVGMIGFLVCGMILLIVHCIRIYF